MAQQDLLDWLFELDQYLEAIVKYAGDTRVALVELQRAKLAIEGHEPDIRSAEYLLRNNEMFLHRNMQYTRGLVTKLHLLAFPRPERSIPSEIRVRCDRCLDTGCANTVAFGFHECWDEGDTEVSDPPCSACPDCRPPTGIS